MPSPLLTARCSGEVRHRKAVNGFGKLKDVWSLSGPFKSIEEAFKKVEAEMPGMVAAVDSTNPFPGLLPDQYRYGRMRVLPDGEDAADVPMFWMINKDDGVVYVVYYNGLARSNDPLLREDKFEGRLAKLKARIQQKRQ